MADSNSLFNALADNTRRDILKMLRKKDMTPSEILTSFSITKPSLSHHLDILKKADLVFTTRNGQNIIYAINTSVFEEVMSLFFDIFGENSKIKKK
jgi:DNA-binding transcriptional ArsR family regulator